MRPHHIAQLLKKLLPESAWPRFAGTVYPAVRPSRRGAGVSFARLADGTWDACFSGFPDRVNFLEPRRAERMVWPGGPRGAARRMLDRYLDDHCRVQKGDVVLDLGANIGEFALLVGDDAARVIAVEGDPGPYRCLERNAERFENIEPVQAVVGEHTGDRRFYLSSENADSSLIRPKRPLQEVRVAVTRVDDLLPTIEVDHVDFVKLDAEGAEPEVLSGAHETLRTCRAIVVDAGPERTGATTEVAVRRLLQHLGFHVWIRDHIVFGLRQS